LLGGLLRLVLLHPGFRPLLVRPARTALLLLLLLSLLASTFITSSLLVGRSLRLWSRSLCFTRQAS
jgi:hypothetical protein